MSSVLKSSSTAYHPQDVLKSSSRAHHSSFFALRAQSCAYDKETVPSLSVTYDPATNRQTGESADANGNICSGGNWQWAFRGVGISALATAQALRIASETSVGNTINLTKNGYSYGGRIPDFVDNVNKLLIEVKAVGYLPNVLQLRDMAKAANGMGYRLQIWILHSTTLSEPLQKLRDEGVILFEEIPYLP